MKQDSLFSKISYGIRDMFYIWRKEMVQVFKDQGVLIFFLLVPLAYPILYAFLYNNETIREVPVAVVDDSRTSLSRDFLRKVDASADVHILSYCSDVEEAKELMRLQKVYGVIVMPSSFSDDLNKGKQTRVQIFCDMSGLLYYKALLGTCTDVSLDMNRSIKISRMGNTTDRQDEVSAKPIAYTNVAMFNPQNGFASFLLPAVLVLIIQQTLLLGVGLAVGTARERNKFSELVPTQRRYLGTFRIVLGKALAYFMVYVVMGSYILCVIPHIFHLVQIPQPWVLFEFLLPYLVACIFFAMTMSIFIRNRETSMLVFVFTSLPLLFISGISWPGAAVPEFWRVFSYIFPSSFGINAFVRINNMGASLQDVAHEIWFLWLQAAFYFFTTCAVYRKQIKRSQKIVDELGETDDDDDDDDETIY